MKSFSQSVSIIVPAAGRGLRMGSAISKQYLMLRGKPILQHTLETLIRIKPKRLILVVGENDEDWQSIPATAECQIVIGGVLRADSVLNGLNSIDDGDDHWVMVHDCVRPCLRAEMIQQLFETLHSDSVGGILALPITDTLKQASQDRIQSTAKREDHYLAQTPQMFRLGVLRRALESAIAQGIEMTDESSAIESLGEHPKVVLGDKRNLKITHPDDLALAEFYLSQTDESQTDDQGPLEAQHIESNPSIEKKP